MKPFIIMYHSRLWICITGIFCVITLKGTVSTAAKTKNRELQIVKEYIPEDCSDIAEVGDEVSVHYTGYLETGSVFDTSRHPSRGPFSFVLGQNKVIQGWEQGIKGMCVGEKRKLIIPSNLAYGKQGHPPTIPADATLTFETELVDVKKSTPDIIFRILRFLVIPFGVVFAIYYIYAKSQKSSTKRDRRESVRRKKK